MISTETLRIQKTLQSSNISSVPLIPFEDDACWSLNITDFPLLWRRSSCFFLGSRLILLSMEAAGCGCHGNAVRGSPCPRSAPPGGRRESWKSQNSKNERRRDDEMKQHSGAGRVSLHLVALGRFHRPVLVFLHGVSDEPHDQEDQDEAEQRADHSASNHPIWHICTKQDIFTSVKGAFEVFLGLHYFTITVINN